MENKTDILSKIEQKRLCTFKKQRKEVAQPNHPTKILILMGYPTDTTRLKII